MWWASNAVDMTSLPSMISCCQFCWWKASETDWVWSDGGLMEFVSGLFFF